ncbi:MAG: hypothetical protein HYY52_01650 [Candidatus Melainabacteria bacterium]|nr:hypothetical protein [Candidatus Melainabacteria bacterium]
MANTIRQVINHLAKNPAWPRNKEIEVANPHRKIFEQSQHPGSQWLKATSPKQKENVLMELMKKRLYELES